MNLKEFCKSKISSLKTASDKTLDKADTLLQLTQHISMVSLNGYDKFIVNNVDKSFAEIYNSNVLVIGGAGSGKTFRFIEPNITLDTASLVVTDAGGVLYNRYKNFLKNHGYTVKVLNLANPARSDNYNPLDYLRPSMLTEDVSALVDILLNGFEEAEYNAAVGELLRSAITFVCRDYPKEKRNFKSVLELVKDLYLTESGFESEVVKHFKEAGERDPSSMVYFVGHSDMLNTMRSQRDNKTVFSKLMDYLATIFPDKYLGLMESDDLDLHLMGDKKTALFITMTGFDTRSNPIISVLLNQLTVALRDRAGYVYGSRGIAVRLPFDVKILLDEFLNLNIPMSVLHKWAISRYYGLLVVFVIQNRDQIKKAYPEDHGELSWLYDTRLFMDGFVGPDANEKLPSYKAWVDGRCNGLAFEYLGTDDKLLPARALSPSDPKVPACSVTQDPGGDESDTTTAGLSAGKNIVLKRMNNSELEVLFNEKIHSKRDREIMRLKFIDGYTYKEIADLQNLSLARVKTIVKDHKAALEGENIKAASGLAALDNSEIETLIVDNIHSEKERDVLRARFIDGLTLDDIVKSSAKWTHRSTIAKILKEGEKTLLEARKVG